VKPMLSEARKNQHIEPFKVVGLGLSDWLVSAQHLNPKKVGVWLWFGISGGDGLVLS
jgi:hypothetical protein